MRVHRTAGRRCTVLILHVHDRAVDPVSIRVLVAQGYGCIGTCRRYNSKQQGSTAPPANVHRLVQVSQLRGMRASILPGACTLACHPARYGMNHADTCHCLVPWCSAARNPSRSRSRAKQWVSASGPGTWRSTAPTLIWNLSNGNPNTHAPPCRKSGCVDACAVGCAPCGTAFARPGRDKSCLVL